MGEASGGEIWCGCVPGAPWTPPGSPPGKRGGYPSPAMWWAMYCKGLKWGGAWYPFASKGDLSKRGSIENKKQ